MKTENRGGRNGQHRPKQKKRTNMKIHTNKEVAQNAL